MQKFVIEGEMKNGVTLSDLWEGEGWYGVKGYFAWLETKTYQMYTRVFLSRYRAYKSCSGLRRDALPAGDAPLQARPGLKKSHDS